jgi:predicted dehydrogenase
MRTDKKIGYAVVGCGWISQAAALPAFAHAGKNSKLVALVSSDPKKLKALGEKYDVSNLYLAENYEECLRNPEVDAVYIALPNSLHCDYTIRAAEHGKHVLCEKPMAVTTEECERMIEVCEENNVKLMIAYRLHFDRANLETGELIRSGKLGEPRLFNSIYSYNIQDPNNTRLKAHLGGGPLYDIGIYCINGARYLLHSEPLSVVGCHATSDDPRFLEVEEAISATLKFPNQVTAQFTCSFGAADESMFEVIGTKGKVHMDSAFELSEDRYQCVTVGDKEKEKTFKKTDQFAPEFLYFSDCILKDKKVEPSGLEGLIDVHIIESIYRAVESGQEVRLDDIPTKAKPNLRLVLSKPAVKEQPLINATSPAA